MAEEKTTTATQTAGAAEQQAVDSSSAKKVKIEVWRPILVNRRRNKFGVLEGTIVNPGTPAAPVVIEVTLDEAKEFCDTPYPGHYNFSGNRTGDSNKHQCYRARRVA